MDNLPIVKISWISHNREYTVGIRRLLDQLGLEPTDDEIMIAVKKLLSEQS